MPNVAVVYGSVSDEAVMQEAFDILSEFGIDFEKLIISAHRQPEKTAEFAQNASRKGIKVIIAGAGLAAALPGVIASHTIIPVIGVPIGGGPLNGVDALYSIVQMPKGIPVAAVGISNARNAALLALAILAIDDDILSVKLTDYRKKLKS
jgi:phosphoribosylaminoimidazole carboxylase PurE protein